MKVMYDETEVTTMKTIKWLQKNMKSSKTNIERKLFRQNIYIDYLPDVIVYCQSAQHP